MIAATPPHAAALAAIHAAAFPAESAWSEAAMAGVLAMPGSFGFLDPHGGMILARAVAGEAEVLTLAVAPERQRQGHGAALLERAFAAVPPMPWYLEVAADNAAALALYAAAGFIACGHRRRYYPDGTDALILRRSPGGDRAP